MRELVFVLTFVFVLMSCQSDAPSGNEVVFGDVVGKYNGECASYTSSTSNLQNREEATLTIFAANTNSAGIKISCDKIMDQNIPVKSASASEIIFEIRAENYLITMTYIAEHDSITIIKDEDGIDENLIFTGKRN